MTLVTFKPILWKQDFYERHGTNLRSFSECSNKVKCCERTGLWILLLCIIAHYISEGEGWQIVSSPPQDESLFTNRWFLVTDDFMTITKLKEFKMLYWCFYTAPCAYNLALSHAVINSKPLCINTHVFYLRMQIQSADAQHSSWLYNFSGLQLSGYALLQAVWRPLVFLLRNIPTRLFKWCGSISCMNYVTAVSWVLHPVTVHMLCTWP